jgi:hypothetical protein
MRRNRADAGTITGIAEVAAERVRLNGELLQALAHAVSANEETQRKFRYVVLSRLARIETTVTAIHGLQLVMSRKWEPHVEEKISADAKASEEFIAQGENELGLAMIRYIYGEGEEAGARPKKRRKWSDCPSFEI